MDWPSQAAFDIVAPVVTRTRPHQIMTGLLAVLMAAAGLQPAGIESAVRTPGSGLLVWSLFFFVIPLGLGVCLLAGARWALMAGVIYGTIGLALDISTIVQELTKGDGRTVIVVMSGVTGLLNLLLILIGGRGFLDVESNGKPPESPPPNLPLRP